MTGQTLGIIIVAGLLGLFVLLLAAALIRSRSAAAAFRQAAAGGPPSREEPKPETRPRPVTRREFFRRSLLASVALFGAQFGAASLAFLWPNLRGGFGSLIDLGVSPDEVRTQIDTDREPFYYGAGRFYLVKYDVDPVPEIYQGYVDQGLMALYQKCAHLGCRVPFCQASQWFECPCHGSKYNRAGEYEDGPAPKGLSRFRVAISQGGTVTVDTSPNGLLDGPPRGTDTIHQDPEGPFCVNISGE